eukprot:g28473.t1
MTYGPHPRSLVLKQMMYHFSKSEKREEICHPHWPGLHVTVVDSQLPSEMANQAIQLYQSRQSLKEMKLDVSPGINLGTGKDNGRNSPVDP